MMMTNSYKHIAPEKNIIDSVEFFPAVIDNFFSEPDIIRKWVNDLPLHKTLEGQWPGFRSPQLHTVDSHFSTTLILKALSTYFNLRYENLTWEDSSVSFSVIEPFDVNKQSPKNEGWVHIDTNSDLAGVIYFTPNADPYSGTSLYKIKPEFENDISFFNRSVFSGK
jgi:hypothetical protein